MFIRVQLYCLKSVDNYLRRLRYLMRYPSIEANVNILYEELKVDKEMHDIFKVCIIFKLTLVDKMLYVYIYIYKLTL